jgi:hypothetical protein
LIYNQEKKIKNLSNKRSLNNKDGKNTWFWTEFIDGKGSFNIFVSKNQNCKIG